MTPQSLEEWQEQQRDEEEQRLRWQNEAQEQQEPDAVPCFRCNASMYQESLNPMENICSSCLAA